MSPPPYTKPTIPSSTTTAAAAPIAIIGGGPCGLVFARLLELAGLSYVVFERDASPNRSPDFQSQNQNRHNGGTLDVHAGTGQAALRAAGLMDEFEKLARRDAAVITVQDFKGGNYFRMGGGQDDKKGEGNINEEEKEGMKGKEKKETKEEDKILEDDRPEIDRLQLRNLLLDSIPAERIRWGKKLLSVDRKDKQDKQAKGETEGEEKGEREGARNWVLRFADGTTETGFRLIVGADGAWSKVRPLITTTKPIYAGKTILEGRLSHGNPRHAAAARLAGPGNSIATGPDACLTVQQMSDGTYRVYAYVSVPEGCFGSGSSNQNNKNNNADQNLNPDLHLDLADTEKTRSILLSNKKMFAAWAPVFRELIESAEGPWRSWPLYYLDPSIFPFPGPHNGEENETNSDSSEIMEQEKERKWHRTPGVVLLGDAAHVGLPNGEGVNLAMLDALELFNCLAVEPGIIQSHVPHPRTDNNNNNNPGSEKEREGETKNDGGRKITEKEKEGKEEDEDATAKIERAIIAYEARMRPRAHEHIEDGIMITSTMCQADGAQRMADMFRGFLG